MEIQIPKEIVLGQSKEQITGEIGKDSFDIYEVTIYRVEGENVKNDNRIRCRIDHSVGAIDTSHNWHWQASSRKIFVGLGDTIEEAVTQARKQADSLRLNSGHYIRALQRAIVQANCPGLNKELRNEGNDEEVSTDER